MADEEIYIPIPRVNPMTFNSYVNNYFNEYLETLTPLEISNLILPIIQGLPFAFYIDIQTWPSIEGYYKSGLTFQPGGSVLLITTNSNMNDYCRIRSATDFQSLVQNGKPLIIDWLINNLDSVMAVDRIVDIQHADNYTAGSMPPAGTDSFIGFRITNARVYAINGSGALPKQTDTLVDLSTGAQFTHLTVVLKNDEFAAFYINNVLVHVETESLPQAGVLGVGWFYHWWVKTTAAATKTFRVGRTLTLNTWPS